jgi:predicted RNase H-like HicB family nuclease
MKTFTAYIEFDPDTELYVGIVPGLPGAHSQGATLTELMANLEEVLQLVLQESSESLDDFPRFVGIQQIQISESAA